MTAGPSPAPASVVLPDGRRLAYAEYGDPDGIAVVLAHGGPGSRLEFAPLDADAFRTRGSARRGPCGVVSAPPPGR